MTTWIYTGVASLLVVGAGLTHGLWTDRWASSDDTREAAERLQELPREFGDWAGQPLERANHPGTGVVGCLQRKYVHKKTGVTVVIALVNGRPGPVATHTPEVCYDASGYLVGAKKPVSMDFSTAPAQFWTADAVRKRATEENRLRLYWAWSVGAGWSASNDARQEFPRYRHPVLHKLYVLRDLNQPGASAGPEPCEEFLRQFLPHMQARLFPKAG